MSGIRSLAPYRKLITRTVMAFFLLTLIWRGYSHVLPFQLGRPVMNKIDYDLVFWAYKVAGLQKWLVWSRAGSAIFTVLVFGFGIASFLYPLKRIFIIPFTLLFIMLGVVFNLNIAQNSHLLVAMMFILFAFWPRKDADFELLWDGMRYYACWVYASAFVWKIINGGIFQSDFGEISFKVNVAWILYENPHGIWASLYAFFLRHPFLLNQGARLLFFMEGLFIAGFFTKKWDMVLIALIVMIHIATWIFSDVVFIEIGVLIFTFLPERVWRRWQAGSRKSFLSARHALE